jgi:ABC-type multidrug transport system ATPase subunit
MSNAIEVKSVTKKFGNFVAVDNLSFTVPEGHIFGFLGPNGSGKSTTLRMMLALISPSQGDVNFFGKPLKKNRSEIMSRIGCIIEKPDFYKYLSAHDNLTLFARANGIQYSKEDYDKLYELVGLSGREKDKVKTYSHGMKQRLGLAQALLHNPDLIILDEPNTGLDPKGIIELRELLLKLNKEEGKTVLFSSHILSEVEALCDSLVVINNGQAVAQGSVSDLLSDEDLLVDIEVSNPAQCKKILEESNWRELIREEKGNHFRLNLPMEEIPKLNAHLIENNVHLIASNYRKRLEDYFLRITQGK